MIFLTALVSVLINNYNYERYIGEAIESVLNQTYKNFELIIVDDGSTDNSRQIIEGYKNKYKQLITTIYKENGGQSSAFNAGFRIAKGDIIAFLDSDDYWFPNKLEKIVELHKEFDIVEHSLLCSGNYCRWTPQKKNAQQLLVKYGEYFRFSETSALSFRKKLLDQVFPIPEEVKICSESYILLNAVYHTNKIKTIRECLAFYRIHGENNYINNPNADKNHMKKFIEIYNSILKTKKLPTIPIGQEKMVKNFYRLNLSKEYKYAIYGLGKISEILTEFLIKNQYHISFYIDSDPNKRCPEKGIFHYTDLSELEEKYNSIIIASSYVRDIKKNLIKSSIPNEKIITLFL